MCCSFHMPSPSRLDSLLFVTASPYPTVDGNVWTSSMQDCTVQRTPGNSGSRDLIVDFGSFASSRVPGYAGCATSGLAVSSDNHIWVTSRTIPGFVVRFDGGGNALAVIVGGANPSGVSIDNLGKPWISCISENNAIRINPVTNVIDVFGSGAIAKTDIGSLASAYNYGDMTGASSVCCFAAFAFCWLCNARTFLFRSPAIAHTLILGRHAWLPLQVVSSSALPHRPRGTGRSRTTVARARTGLPSLGPQPCHSSRR